MDIWHLHSYRDSYFDSHFFVIIPFSLSLVSVSFALFLAHGDDGGLSHVDDDDLEGGPDDGGHSDDDANMSTMIMSRGA